MLDLIPSKYFQNPLVVWLYLFSGFFGICFLQFLRLPSTWPGSSTNFSSVSTSAASKLELCFIAKSLGCHPFMLPFHISNIVWGRRSLLVSSKVQFQFLLVVLI